MNAEALARYQELPLPDTTEEHWRFTDLRGFDPDTFEEVRGAVPEARPAETMLDLDVAGLATITESGVSIERAPEGITFQRLDEGSVTTHLKEIARKEKVKLSEPKVLSAIYESTNGDLRQAINLLQAASASGEVTLERVGAVTGTTVKGRVGEIMRLALDGEFENARLKMIELTRVYGIPERDFLKFANEELTNQKGDGLGDAIKILAEYDYRLVMGAQPELQLTAMLAELSALKNRKGE